MRARGLSVAEACSPEGREALRAFAAQRPRRRRKGTSTAVVDFEAVLAFQIQLSKLPPPARQLKFCPPRRFTADFAWPQFLLVVEVQGGIWRTGGGAHSHPSNILRDVEKAQVALLAGWRIFPVTTDEVKNGQALELIELALQKLGWKP